MSGIFDPYTSEGFKKAHGEKKWMSLKKAHKKRLDAIKEGMDPSEQIYALRFRCVKIERQIVGNWTNLSTYNPKDSITVELHPVVLPNDNTSAWFVEGPYSRIRLGCLHPDFREFFGENHHFIFTITRVKYDRKTPKPVKHPTKKRY